MKKLPTLYKKTSTGAIQQWNISVEEITEVFGVPLDVPVALIWTKYGQVDGAIQETADKITEGKNPGKKNATTPVQQAMKEAKAKWEKQKKKGYVETEQAAQNNEVDDLIEGGVVPMLAQKFSEHAHKIKYPAFVQPKLDGVRCVAIVKNGKCTLWSRTRKPITSCPHIVAELEKRFTNIVLDGELYNHAYKTNFEKIVSLVRQEVPDADHELVQYHIYDVINDEIFSRRLELLSQQGKTKTFTNASPLRFVQTDLLTEDEVMLFFDRYRREGYEGAMLRNRDSKYVNKRSYDLQKVKEFDDGEFEIVGIDEGRGKLQGHVGSFVCRTSTGKEFLAKMSGDTGKLKEYFLDHSLWKGKFLTVKYQGFTGKETVPRFPVGLRIREAE